MRRPAGWITEAMLQYESSQIKTTDGKSTCLYLRGVLYHMLPRSLNGNDNVSGSHLQRDVI